MEPLTYIVLRTVSSLMADLNVVSNLEFLCCFVKALISLVKASFRRPDENPFKTLYKSIVKNVEFV